MAYGFYAYIDEAGDQGFTFRDPPDRASSQWFVLSAVVMRENTRGSEARAFGEFAKTVSQQHWSKLHFRYLRHERRAAMTRYLSQRSIRVISICWNKKTITEDDRDHTLHDKTRLCHYCIRYLVERISWLARDNCETRDAMVCRLVFSKCKNLRYSFIQDYLRVLNCSTTTIHWPAIDIEKFIVKPPSELHGLQMADAVSSSIYRGLELDPHGRAEPTYARHLRPITYKRGNNYLTYGLKIMPRVPPVEPQYDNRYEWINDYR